MIHPAVRDLAGPGPDAFEHSEKPTDSVSSPNSHDPRYDGERPPPAKWKPCLPNISRAELRRIVIEILG